MVEAHSVVKGRNFEDNNEEIQAAYIDDQTGVSNQTQADIGRDNTELNSVLAVPFVILHTQPSVHEWAHVRCISCEEAEIRQLERRVARASSEAETLRTDIITLLEQLKQLEEDTEPQISLAKLSALLEAKREDIRELEKEVPFLQAPSSR
ncbi:hypothetical protein DFH05DRAFT_1520280 [Lentinula detonsa]|uniref:Uncharacterized protein n=1 Tax=Lentinula detonsa TaxID=2804962 RepID=A0A9W8P7X2_9AGAR|nr:hypothetical protein DFH05DRAFT_1520280 [Lentinula detonsa]